MFINTHETGNGTRKLTQQDFCERRMFETLPTTTQQSSSPIHPKTTPTRKKTIIHFIEHH